MSLKILSIEFDCDQMKNPSFYNSNNNNDSSSDSSDSLSSSPVSRTQCSLVGYSNIKQVRLINSNPLNFIISRKKGCKIDDIMTMNSSYTISDARR
jgi:hypothetical protein